MNGNKIIQNKLRTVVRLHRQQLADWQHNRKDEFTTKNKL